MQERYRGRSLLIWVTIFSWLRPQAASASASPSLIPPAAPGSKYPLVFSACCWVEDSAVSDRAGIFLFQPNRENNDPFRGAAAIENKHTKIQKNRRPQFVLFCLLDFRFQRVVVATAAVAVVVSSSRRTEKDHINGKDDEKTKWGEEAMKDVAACRWLVVGGPRKLGARGVGIDGRLGVVVDDAAGGSLEDDEAGDALDAPGIGEALALCSLEGHCGPGHGVPVGAEGGLLVVKGHEEDLKLARRSLLHLVVECSRCWREGSAWRAPVCAKVDAEVFLGLEQRSNIDQVDVFAHHGRAEQ